MGKKQLTLILLTFLVTLQLFNGLLFGSNVNLTVLPVYDTNLSLNTASISNATVISDDSTGWNVGLSEVPSVAVDGNGNVHVVWSDATPGVWGGDREIMYVNYTEAGWSNVTAISDVYGWNDGSSWNPSIVVDNSDNLHVVWDDYTDGEWGSDIEIMYTNYTASGWSNATCISDVYGWNNDTSIHPSVAVASSGNVYVVWRDHTNGEWGTDEEIMGANYTAAAGWSNATVISDDSTGWNDGNSRFPSVAVDSSGNMHAVWEDWTVGEWGTDYEIMYVNYTASVLSNATAISDIYGWNDGFSQTPSITVDDSDNLHVAWEDVTAGEWGSDQEIMYASYTASGWSNATVISDVYGWNDDTSIFPSVAVDGSGNVHVVWEDLTDGEWGSDHEIMYTKYTSAGWSNATVISDDATGWNDGNSYEPSVAVDGSGNVHVVWEDETIGEWGADREIMYAKISIPKDQVTLDLLLLFLGGAQPGLMEQLPFILVGIGVAVLVVIIIIVVKKRQ